MVIFVCVQKLHHANSLDDSATLTVALGHESVSLRMRLNFNGDFSIQRLKDESSLPAIDGQARFPGNDDNLNTRWRGAYSVGVPLCEPAEFPVVDYWKAMYLPAHRTRGMRLGAW